MIAPRITVRLLAEILHRPKASHTARLRDQKYPKQEPQASQVIPFYQRAATAVRHYYKGANDPAVLQAARNAADKLPNKSKRTNILRVLEKFPDTPHAQRRLEVRSNDKHFARLDRVELKLSTDMQATENGKLRYVYFGYTEHGIDPEQAILQIELAHWVLEQNKVKVSIDQIEYLDLSTGKRYRADSRRATTIRAATAQGARISALWDDL